MTGKTIDPAVARYAAEVRQHLSDLPPDDLDDLTSDLEANLTEALVDAAPLGADPAVVFGDPRAYAAELRAAAGIAAARPTGRRPGVFEAAVGLARGFADGVRSQPWWPVAADTARALAPAWWVARGWAVAVAVVQLLTSRIELLPRTAAAWVLLLVCVIVSIRWERGQWRGRAVSRLAYRLVTAFALVAVPLYALWGPGAVELETTRQAGGGLEGPSSSPSNLFVYDAEGAPVPGAQIVDEEGRPFDLYADAHEEWGTQGIDGRLYVPPRDALGDERWNSYPLSIAPPFSLDPSSATVPAWPFAVATPVEPAPGASPAPTPTVSGAPTPETPHQEARSGASPDAPDSAATQAPQQ